MPIKRRSSMINIINLTQTYKSGKGIFNLDFTIQKGEIFGYLGPNGAGKTTTIRNILGFMNPSEGKVIVNGINTRKNSEQIMHSIGYLPGEISFYDNLKGNEFLDLLANLRKLKDFSLRKELENRFQLNTSTTIKKMSKGMKQKLAIIAAFMHNPDILILDEPTSGLDPLMQNIFLEMILDEKSKGKTVLLSSHMFEEVERVCDRVGIIKEGKLITIEDINSIKQKSIEVFEITLKEPDKTLLETNLEVVWVQNNKYRVSINNDYKQFFTEIQNFEVIKMVSVKQSIEDIFMKYYSGEEHE